MVHNNHNNMWKCYKTNSNICVQITNQITKYQKLNLSVISQGWCLLLKTIADGKSLHEFIYAKLATFKISVNQHEVVK